VTVSFPRKNLLHGVSWSVSRSVGRLVKDHSVSSEELSCEAHTEIMPHFFEYVPLVTNSVHLSQGLLVIMLCNDVAYHHPKYEGK
jgi:hypothetical protein